MLHAQYGRWLLLTLAGSFGCSYDFGGGSTNDGGDGGSASTSPPFTSNVATSSKGANANANASSSTGIAPDLLADCGFEDTFDNEDLWLAFFADVVGGHAETMTGVLDAGYTEYDGGFVSKQSFGLSNCFLSIRVDAATSVGSSFLAIEDVSSSERAVELQISSEREEGGVLVRGVRYAVYLGDGGEPHVSAMARVEHPTYLGLWVDGATQSMRVFVRDDATWVAVGSLPPAPYVDTARISFGSFAWATSPSAVASIFDDLNGLPVTRTELENASPMIMLDDDGGFDEKTGDH